MDQLEATMGPEESRDFETTISDLLNSKDTRKAEAVSALDQGDIEAAGDHLLKVARQDGSAATDFAKNSRDTYREAGSLFYPIDTRKAIEAYQACLDHGSKRAWDHIYLGRLYLRGGQSNKAKAVLEAGLQNSSDPHDRMVLSNDLGDIISVQNDLNAAKAYYEDGLKVAKTLADGDPGNAEYQRDLIVSFSKLAAAEPENALSWCMQAKAVSDSMTVKGQFAPVDAHIPGMIDAEIALLSAN